MNDDTKSIYQKLIDARKAFHSTSIVKTGYNDFSKYSYFELSDFLVPAMTILADEGLIPIISFDADLATMTVHDVTSDATIVITSPMSSATLKACQPIQSMAACETFNRRYLYTALLEIVEHDAIERTGGDPKNEPAGPATDEQMITIQDYLDSPDTPDVTKAFIKKRMPFDEVAADKIITQLKENL